MTTNNPNVSTIATQHQDRRPDPKRAGSGKPWGACCHTSSRSVPDKAHKLGRRPLDVALDYYDDARYSTHYVVPYEGDAHQITPDDHRVMHIGSTPAALRELYLKGDWARDGRNDDGKRFSAETVAQWRKRWPGARSPQHLFPSRDQNTDYVGIEMIPLATRDLARAMRPGLWFTLAQHQGAARLLADLGKRHGWTGAHARPVDAGDGIHAEGRWWRTSRLVGHEDVGLHNRTDAGGGWDPGAMRAAPRFDWASVLAQLDAA